MQTMINTSAKPGLARLGLVLLCLGGPAGAWAAGQQLTATCTTAPTGTDGVRSRCRAEPVKVQAPTGHVFVQESLSGGEVSGSGSEHACELTWQDWVEVDAKAGTKRPTTAVLNASARGPQEKLGGRGWVNCRYVVDVQRRP